MVKIVADTSTLYSAKEAKEIDLDVIPLNVIINNQTYREFDEISSQEFLDLINQGHMPTSSQPSVGEKEDLYSSTDEEIIDLTMASGLSGTYHGALVAKESVDKNDHIHVVNTKTLCGPHRYIVNKALALAKQNLKAQDIIHHLEDSINIGTSFLIPCDFNYLKRGGRLSPLAATLGGLIRIIPVLQIAPDGTHLNKFAVKKTIKKAINNIIEYMQNDKVDDSYYISIAHANNLEWFNTAKELIGEAFKNVTIECLELSPAFITQGGPGCIAIQYCKK